MARAKKPRTRTDLIISLVVHAIVIGGIFYWAAKTGIIPEEISKVFNIAQNKKPAPPKPKPPEPPKPTKQELKNAAIQPTTAPPPSSAGPSVKMADTSALGARGDAVFGGAAVRDSNAAPASVVQGQGTMGGLGKPVSTAAPKVSMPTVTGLSQSMFSKEATRPSTVASVLEERKMSAAAQDSISSEQISRSGASDAAAVVGKVAGASIVEGKFVVVRGLSDRYNVTTLNGADIPTADPYRKAAQLDLIPSSMVDRIVVNKTFTPDQPGGFAGGAVNVVTKSFPAKGFATVSFGVEYNTQSSLRDDFLTYEGGETDWLGMDDGTRALPDELVGRTSLPDPPSNAPRNEPPAQAAARRAQADELARLTKSFQTTQFAPVKGDSPLNHSFSLAFGDTALLFGRPLGAFASLSYKRDYYLYLDGVSARYDNMLESTKSFTDMRGVEDVNWGAAVNLAWQPFADHEFAFTFLRNQSSEDTARRRVGTARSRDDAILDLNTLQFIERDLQSFQFKGRHVFPEAGNSRLDWLVSLSQTSQEEPDLRYFNYFHAPDGSFFVFAGPDQDQPDVPTRFFRELQEDNFNLKIDGSVPFRWWDGLTGELKGGFFLSNSERTYSQQSFEYRTKFPAGQSPYPGFVDPTDPNTFLSPGTLDYVTQVVPGRGTNYFFPRYLAVPLSGNQGYDGTQEIKAFYGMATLPLHDRVRLIGGGRVESTQLEVDSVGFSGPSSSKLNQTDVLPAVSGVFSISSNVSLRLSFTETITRPTYREIAGVRAYDLPTDTLLEGNPNLRISSIKNYDARLEWFPRPGEVFAVSVFYKQIIDPIEKEAINQEANILSYANRPEATIYGLELEARKNLDFLGVDLRYFSVGMNLSLITSEVPLNETDKANKGPFATDVRPLYDQSPYIFNADLNFNQPEWGTSVSLIASIAGERVFFVNPAGPDIYEHPPTSLDLVVSQRLSPRLRLKFSAKNLLDPPYQVTYDKEPGQYIYTSYTRGRLFGISLAYDF